MSGKIEYFKPKLTTDLDLEQAFLNQILVPKISNNNHALSFFFKKQQEALDVETKRSEIAADKIIQLNAKYGCDFESYMRNSKLENRKEHIKFMQTIKPHQLAAMSPYARFYVVDSTNLKKSTFKKTAIPISFSKSFDLDFFLKNRKSTARGEGAGIISINANRIYNITGDYDPITLNAQFFFSSYEVLINKPAIEQGTLSGLSYGGNNFGAFTGFFNKVQNITYKELIKRSTEFRLVLEYGWTYSDGVSDDILSRKEKEIIDKFEKVYYKITPITHKINFNQDGSFTLNVEYIPSPLADLENKPGLGEAIVDKILSEKAVIKKTKLGRDILDMRKRVIRLKQAIKRYKQTLKTADAEKVEKAFREKGKINPFKKGTLQRRLFASFKRLKKLSQNLQSLLKDSGPLFANYIIEDFKNLNLFNSYSLKTEIKRSNDVKKINNTLKVKIGLAPGNPTRTYFESGTSSSDAEGSIEDQALDILINVETYEQADDKAALRDEAENIRKSSEKIIEATLKNHKKNQKETSTTFIFFKDILRGIYNLSESYDKNNTILYSTNNPRYELPYYILGNVAYPLPTGDKYWCNIGDLALTEGTLRQILIDFFKNYPNANFKKFINFFVQKALPTAVINKNNIAAFPSLSYPYYHFDIRKFEKDFLQKTPAVDKKYNKLFQGDEKVFDDFCKGYFDSADIKSSTGCFFIGQSSNLLYENSGIFLGKRVARFRETFFKKDGDLLDTGISKLVIGSSNGLLKNLSFNSNSDDTLTNLSHVLNEKKPGVPDDIISTNFQYTISAELFGNRVYEFSNLIYVPSYTLGKGVASIPDNPTPQQLQRLREQNRSNDFEIGGLYTINNVSDNLQLANGVYTKTINASTLIRDSQLLLARLKDLQDNKVLFPSDKFNQDLSTYIASNYDKLSTKIAKKADKVKK
tara:strand:- start:2784 stop:5555 length:2772 start_codon:yes stop_codon:yes gene_type:complete